MLYVIASAGAAVFPGAKATAQRPSNASVSIQSSSDSTLKIAQFKGVEPRYVGPFSHFPGSEAREVDTVAG
jgi:hypothetical protein